ncbi:hypothetical protein AUEXF2481DRAFT_80798 [Aureobasidium subglaciale EXF-2481]|uniref:Uncharacterized protein n=1 Tax=Aureobasidium subglaciale (strain EXF-2481) TaxID=1043005 RepID=A0A074YIS1_AURSE|nr:uncharacterized protein AUEXF2481DRAFT_80798 [Aureobasidium subglaciale EXF-2481]KEQ93987.1 hypothetical protein AUEXF2481DRAFT_80798 [Aureobasidium subglaciale EXF-2481]
MTPSCATAGYRGALDLSNELLHDIFDLIAADPERLVSVDKRAYLSQESFRPEPLPSQDQVVNIGKFRLLCRRFAALGASHQYARVTTRFSSKGLARLEAIADQPHLAKHVKKFSYKVPYFCTQGRESILSLDPQVQQTIGKSNIERFRSKIYEQQKIVKSKRDVEVLKKAMKAFVALQHVQILRVQDQEDENLLTFIRYHQNIPHFVELKWAPACAHSARTIGNALLDAQSSCSRFSSPMLSPQSALVLAENPTGSFSTLAERLTCLELHFDDGYFDDGTDLEVRMYQLSPLFQTVFTAAVNMEAIHVGFPSHRPIGLPLETIFHNVRWTKLIAFGIQGWRLHEEEIIQFAQRHKDRLRGLRLRDVMLREGSMWKNILSFLHTEMRRLDWVSLRRIDYTSHFDELWQNAGIELPDDPPGGLSSSDSDSDSDNNTEDLYWSDTSPHLQPTESPDWDSVSHLSNISDSDHADSDDEDRGRAAHEMDFPTLNSSPDTPNSATWCNCNGRSFPVGVEELGDDGVSVDHDKWKMWEKWVLGRCPEHGC